MRKFVSVALLLVVAGCFSQEKRLPLSPAERCAEDGLILMSRKGAEASGFVGRVFAGSGKTESCGRPNSQLEVCEVEGNRRSALVKQTRPGTAETKIMAADAYSHARNECMASYQPAAQN